MRKLLFLLGLLATGTGLIVCVLGRRDDHSTQQNQGLHAAVSNEPEIVAACLVFEVEGRPETEKLLTAVMDAIQNRKRQMNQTVMQVIAVPATIHFARFHDAGADAVRQAKISTNWPTALHVVELAESGKLPNLVGDATYWYPVNETTNHPYKRPTAIIGGIAFSVVDWTTMWPKPEPLSHPK